MTRVNQKDIPLDFFINADEETQTLHIEVNGVDTIWEYRQMSWWEKNKCVSKSTTIIPADSGPTFGFDLATYYAEALQIMLVSAPMPVTPTTMKTLRDPIGSKLQAIVPAPLDDSVGEAAKKESEESSAEKE